MEDKFKDVLSLMIVQKHSSMPVYTICNFSRQISKLVVGDSLEEIKLKAVEKLGYKPDKIVLEENGVEIEEDEVLVVLSLKDKIMVLNEGEEWCKADNELGAFAGSIDTMDSPRGKVLQVPSSSSTAIITTATPAAITTRTPLPRFSDYVQVKLRNNESHVVWGQCVREAAYYYLSEYPNIGKGNQADYQTLGACMCREYPSIRRDGTHPWSAFAKDLSSRIRHVRWTENRKSLFTQPQMTEGLDSTPPKTMRLVQEARSAPNKQRKIPEDELEQHLVKLGKLAKDMEQNNCKDEDKLIKVAKDVNVLLKETYVNRRDWIEAQRESGSVKQITDRYPCFINPIFVFAELKLIKGKELWITAQENIDRLFQVTGSVLQKDGKINPKEGLEADIATFLFLEKETAYDRGKGRKTASILTVNRDLSADEVDKATQKLSNELSPILIMFVNNDSITHAIVKADNVNLTSCTNFRKCLLHLLSVYYIAWISYPRQYSQILGLLQHFILGEMFTEHKSKKYVHFAHILSNVWPKE